MSSAKQFTSIGGQAVIEGVMMRSPHFIAVAVRKPNQRIAIRSLPFQSVAQRFPIFKKPMLRGVVMLLESMIQGIDALSYSAGIAGAELASADGAVVAANLDLGKIEKPEELSGWAVFSSIALAIVLGMGLFVALPHFLTAVITGRSGIDAQSPLFHLLDGALKMTILLSYVYLIALMKDVHRVFQYHGAEHKSIYAFEAGEESHR